MICNSDHSKDFSPSDLATSETVLAICVKYGADEETERYLQSLRLLQSKLKLHVMVVENTGASNWLPHAQQFNCHVVQAPRNLGYFGGARYGLSQYLKEKPIPDWVIVSNVDLAIPDHVFLDRLGNLDLPRDVALVAPCIRSNLTGIDQNPYLRVRPSPLRMHLYKWLYRSRLALNAHELSSTAVHRVAALFRPENPSRESNSRQEIYAAHGSFLIFTRSYFESGGDLDYPGFLFGEEIYVAEKIRSLKLKVMFDPSLVVVHEEHRATRLFKSPEIARYVATSATYCADNLFPLRNQN